MPLRKIRMIISKKNVQTTPSVAFREGRMNGNPGRYDVVGPNPLIGWRKQLVCSCDNGIPNHQWQEVVKNVNGPDCCLPRNKSIQNTARSSPAQTARNGGVPYRVSGKIDKTYNHNYRQYLRKRCRIASYDLKGESSFTFPDGDGHKNVGQKGCCTTDCTGDVQSNHATYKRSNWKFRKQGAVSDSAYIAAKAFTTSNFCCCCYLQEIVWDPTGGIPPPALGHHVTQSTTGAAGVIISLTTGSSTYTATLKLDDCNNVFVSGSLATLSVDGTAQGSGSFSARAPTACEEYNGRGPPERPREPGNNPKNYNKH